MDWIKVINVGESGAKASGPGRKRGGAGVSLMHLSLSLSLSLSRARALSLSLSYFIRCVERVIFGMRSVTEVERNIASLSEAVPAKIWADAQQRGLLPAELRFE